ncbi:SlyX family protein [Consotaella aegiceratis]|uniref:SlyX family protein n=1 Tax=Consotaella aegiceratis TaxID=3097961 RepID=UPI002F3E36A7
MADTARTEDLEIQLAHQAKTIDELSEQVARQWAEIDQLKKTLTEVARRLVALEDTTAPRPGTAKPPHW